MKEGRKDGVGGRKKGEHSAWAAHPTLLRWGVQQPSKVHNFLAALASYLPLEGFWSLLCFTAGSDISVGV